MRSLVLGCGPAGLMAAHAITVMTSDQPVIVSKARKSELYGAQYLHGPVALVTDRQAPVMLQYRLLGDAAGYSAKVYGDNWAGKTSPEDLMGEHYAWDIRAAYDILWDLYGVDSLDRDLRNIGPGAIERLVEPYEFVVSSIPKPLLCYQGHTFASQKAWALGDAPGRSQRVEVRVDVNTVVCNGQQFPSWYRASNVFGFATVEWPEGNRPPISGVAEIDKPLWNNCDCWPDIVHVGRYGDWTKGVLSHDAYYKVAGILR